LRKQNEESPPKESSAVKASRSLKDFSENITSSLAKILLLYPPPNEEREKDDRGRFFARFLS
jgi:hypothetical protein